MHCNTLAFTTIWRRVVLKCDENGFWPHLKQRQGCSGTRVQRLTPSLFRLWNRVFHLLRDSRTRRKLTILSSSLKYAFISLLRLAANLAKLYTKAYELFKKHTPTLPQSQSQARLTLWIAYRIGQTYFDSGKFDMAVRFVAKHSVCKLVLTYFPGSLSASQGHIAGKAGTLCFGLY